MLDSLTVSQGLFNTTIPVISDGRSFNVKVTFSKPGYQTEDVMVFVDQSFVDSKEI